MDLSFDLINSLEDFDLSRRRNVALWAERKKKVQKIFFEYLLGQSNIYYSHLEYLFPPLLMRKTCLNNHGFKPVILET